MAEEEKRLGKMSELTGWTGLLLGVGAGTAAEASSATADRALIASFTLAAAAVLAALRLRTQSRRAPILRYGVGLMLAMGLIAAILAAIGPSSLAPFMIFGAVALTGAAVLAQTETRDRPDMLSGIAFLGGLATLARWADAGVELSDWILPTGLVLTVVGMMVAGLAGWKSPGSMVAVGAGLLVAGAGVALLMGRQLPGIIFVGLGLAIIVVAVAELVGRESPDWIMQIVVGLSTVGIGVAELVGRQLPVGIAFIGGGIGVVGYGVSAFRKHQATSVDPGKSGNLDGQELASQSGKKPVRSG